MHIIETHLEAVKTNMGSQNLLKKSCWRKLAGLVAFIQLTFFLTVSLFFLSAAFIQVHTGVAPFQNHLYHAIHSGVLVTAIHRDIIQAHSFGIFSESDELMGETVEKGVVQEGVTVSNDLKIELQDADWGTLLSIYIFIIIITAIQCWRGAQLLRASLKWENPPGALRLIESWRISMSSFRNYLVGFIVGTSLFAGNVSGIVVLVFVLFWLVLCLLSASAYGYYKELSIAVVHKYEDDTEDI